MLLSRGLRTLRSPQRTSSKWSRSIPLPCLYLLDPPRAPPKGSERLTNGYPRIAAGTNMAIPTMSITVAIALDSAAFSAKNRLPPVRFMAAKRGVVTVVQHRVARAEKPHRGELRRVALRRRSDPFPLRDVPVPPRTATVAAVRIVQTPRPVRQSHLGAQVRGDLVRGARSPVVVSRPLKLAHLPPVCAAPASGDEGLRPHEHELILPSLSLDNDGKLLGGHQVFEHGRGVVRRVVGGVVDLIPTRVAF